MSKKTVIVTMLVIGLTVALSATNGYFSHGYGAKSKSMAGAGTAMVLSTLDSVSNPAAMVFLGKRIDIGAALFNPNREYTVSGNPSMYPGTFPLNPGTFKSDTKAFIMPHMGGNFMLNPETSFGITVYGNGGMNTDYNTATFHGTAPTGVNLAQLFVDLTVSRKLSPTQSIGITGIVAYQYFKASGLEAFSMFSSDPANMTNNGNDSGFGFGVRVGYLGRFSRFLSLGASYQTKVKMQSFDKYAGLFAEQGGFDIPASYNLGLALHASPTLTLAIDVQKVMYSKVKAIANPMNPMDFATGVLLGDENGAGFGWKDMTIVKGGIQWKANRFFTLRAGYSSGEQPIPESEVMFNILAPGVIEQHLTLGGTIKLRKKAEFSFYLMHAFSNSVSGRNPMEFPGQQIIELKMNQWEVGIEFSF
jgi:long-chain fatty acid transport protein